MSIVVSTEKARILELVDSLGLKVVGKKSQFLMLVSKKTNKSIASHIKVDNVELWLPMQFRGYNQLLYALLNEIYEYADDYHTITTNPCFGCKSLDEALIKKDLIYNE